MVSMSNGRRSALSRRRPGANSRSNQAPPDALGVLEAATTLLHADAAALLSSGSRPAVVAFTGSIGRVQLADLTEKLRHGERFPQTIDGWLIAVVPFLDVYFLAVAFHDRLR